MTRKAALSKNNAKLRYRQKQDFKISRKASLALWLASSSELGFISFPAEGGPAARPAERPWEESLAFSSFPQGVLSFVAAARLLYNLARASEKGARRAGSSWGPVCRLLPGPVKLSLRPR